MQALETLLQSWLNKLRERYHDPCSDQTFVPWSDTYQFFARRGLTRRQTRQLGNELQDAGIITIQPNGWVIA